MRFAILLSILLCAACDTPAEPDASIVLDGADSWRVTEWLPAGEMRVWWCDNIATHDSGTVTCYFSGGGYVKIQGGTFEVHAIT